MVKYRKILQSPSAFFYIKSGGTIVPPVTKFVPPVRKVRPRGQPASTPVTIPIFHADSLNMLKGESIY